MSNLDNILGAITKKAEEKRDEILENANIEANNIIDSKNLEANNKSDEIINKAKTNAAIKKTSELKQANIKSRDILLDGKNKLMDDILDKSIERLRKLDKDEYYKYVKNIIDTLDIKDGSIMLSEEYRDDLLSYDFNNLYISKQTTEDGFIVRDNNAIYDYTFRSIIDYNKDMIKLDISNKLFEGEL